MIKIKSPSINIFISNINKLTTQRIVERMSGSWCESWLLHGRKKLQKSHFGKLLQVCFLADFRLFFLTGSRGLLSQENEEKEEKESVKEKSLEFFVKYP